MFLLFLSSGYYDFLDDWIYAVDGGGPKGQIERKIGHCKNQIKQIKELGYEDFPPGNQSI